MICIVDFKSISIGKSEMKGIQNLSTLFLTTTSNSIVMSEKVVFKKLCVSCGEASFLHSLKASLNRVLINFKEK